MTTQNINFDSLKALQQLNAIIAMQHHRMVLTVPYPEPKLNAGIQSWVLIQYNGSQDTTIAIDLGTSPFDKDQDSRLKQCLEMLIVGTYNYLRQIEDSLTKEPFINSINSVLALISLTNFYLKQGFNYPTEYSETFKDIIDNANHLPNGKVKETTVSFNI